MLEDDAKSCQVWYSLPTEVLFYIFQYLPARDLIKCRQVCCQWRYVIDGLVKNEFLWREHCRKDFESVYLMARNNARIGMTWFNLYRSLALWPKLATARDVIDEFASASSVQEQILDLRVLQNGNVAVHKKGSIVYYDIETLEESKRAPLIGHYLRYAENSKVVAILGLQLHLFLIRKAVYSTKQEKSSTFHNVNRFFLNEQKVYFCNTDDEIFVVDLEKPEIRAEYVTTVTENIICLSFNDNHIHVLTFARNVYSIVRNRMASRCTLDNCCNFLQVLIDFEFLDQMDWTIYNQWMFLVNRPVPQGPLQNIKVMKTYGDMIFVGSNWGVLRIYYYPYRDDEFDLYSAEPVKQYNFMERLDCPVLTDSCPIIQIDVLESEDGHTVLAAMPKKIAVLEFVHTFKRTASVAMLPYYREVQKVKVLRIDDSV